MTRARNRRLPHATVLALAAPLLVVGCSDAPAARPRSTPATPVSQSSGTPAPEPSPPEASPTGKPSTEEPGSLETPEPTSGRLSRRDFPRPADLGPAWSYAVDAGNAEEGYLGNGTPALARDPQEIVQTAVPFGCARRSPLPAPRHALEVDYTARGTAVIAIRSQFADPATARTFFDHRSANLQACVGRGGGAVGPLVTDLEPLDDDVLVNGRTQRSDPWMELAVLDGDAVVLVAARNRADQPPLNRSTAGELARSFRTR